MEFRSAAVPTGHAAGTTGGPDASVVVRPLETLAEFRACVALQDEVWGPDFSERVPLSLLKVVVRLGGLAIGAFTEGGELIGMVFGLTGVHDGEVVHWSHMLAVRESVRNLGVGRALKEHQRAELARRGIRAMMWTFDPLQAKNAHLNLNVLGARVISFEPNMYGRTESPLHNGLQTDRLLVSCETVRHPVRRVYTHQELGAPLLTIEPLADDTLLDRTIGALPRQMRIEVPAEFAQLMRKAPSRAAAWHAAFREQCQWAVRHDYVITGFHRDAVSSRAFYLLTMEGTRA